MKRQKAYFGDIIDLEIEYHGFQNVKTKNGLKGIRYILSNALTEKQKSVLAKFKNVIFSSCYFKYDSSIRYNTIILTDKIIKSEV